MSKKLLYLLLIIPYALFAQEKDEQMDFNRLSETLGHLLVNQLKQPGFEFSLDHIIQGMRNEQAGKPSPMTQEEYEQAMFAIQERQFLESSELNLKEANAFLMENRSKEGIHEIEPKLQFQICKEGTGAVVHVESVPLIHYKGSLLDGTLFSSSEAANQPVALPLKQTISGFAKGLVGMKEGEKRILYIHPDLAYGISGHLPPNSLLIFEVEIVKANSALGSDIAQTATDPVEEPIP